MQSRIWNLRITHFVSILRIVQLPVQKISDLFKLIYNCTNSTGFGVTCISQMQPHGSHIIKLLAVTTISYNPQNSKKAGVLLWSKMASEIALKYNKQKLGGWKTWWKIATQQWTTHHRISDVSHNIYDTVGILDALREETNYIYDGYQKHKHHLPRSGIRTKTK